MVVRFVIWIHNIAFWRCAEICTFPLGFFAFYSPMFAGMYHCRQHWMTDWGRKSVKSEVGRMGFKYFLAQWLTFLAQLLSITYFPGTWEGRAGLTHDKPRHRAIVSLNRNNLCYLHLFIIFTILWMNPRPTLLLCFTLFSSILYLSASSSALFKRTSVVPWLAEACFCARLRFSSSYAMSQNREKAEDLLLHTCTHHCGSCLIPTIQF